MTGSLAISLQHHTSEMYQRAGGNDEYEAKTCIGSNPVLRRQLRNVQ
jgi:hypothetical protein